MPPPSTSAQHIGLFGGSFNPVHRGHLLAASAVQQQLDLDQCCFIPAAQSPFKNKPELSDEHRLAMLRRALKPHPRLCLDTRELAKDGPSYTINTLKALVEEHPLDRRYLLLGMDAWLGFERWRDWQAISQLCHLVVMTRPNFHPPKLSEFWQRRYVQETAQLKQIQTGKLFFIQVMAGEAASSMIRQHVRNGEPLNHDLPSAVAAYIHTHQLYR